MSRILVVNPNSTEAVTRGIDEACEPLRMQGGPAIDVVTLKEGPPGIETQQQVDSVVPHLIKMVQSWEPRYDAFVIACYSDPGLHSLREATRKPVLGISECGILTALTLGQRLGVIAILEQSIPRHLRYMGALGVMDRLAAELPVGLGVTELADEEMVMIPPGFGHRVLVDELFAEAGVTPRVSFESAELATIEGLVAAGLGLGIVPEVFAGVSGTVGVGLTAAGARRTISLVWRTDRPLAPPAQRFLDHVRDQVAGPGDPLG